MVEKYITMFFVAFLCLNFSSAGVGLLVEHDTLYIQEGKKACITYGITNPFSNDAYAEVLFSGESSEFLETQSVDKLELPAQTGIEEALPVEFCFEANIEAQCTGDSNYYEGKVLVKEIPPEGATGSVVSGAVSNSLNLEIICQNADMAKFEGKYFGTQGQTLDNQIEEAILFAIIALIVVLAFLIYLKYSKRMRRKEEHLRTTKTKYKKK